MVQVKNYFDVVYGTNLELANLEQDAHGINFVSRTAANNGISAKVKWIPKINPNPANTISVACGGSVMESFLQKEPYYSGRDLFFLKPKIELSDNQLLFYCMCLRSNKYRYNYGRQANKTLATLNIPSLAELPSWVADTTIPTGPKSTSLIAKNYDLHPKTWGKFKLSEFFTLKKGKRLTIADMSIGNTPFVGAIDSNNGWREFINAEPNHPANTISVNYNGSVAEAFYQTKDYWASDDVNVLYPKFELNKYIAMFIVTVIRQERYRFNYGRKWHLERMKNSIIRLPITKKGKPDWIFMENFIKSMKSSSNL